MTLTLIKGSTSDRFDGCACRSNPPRVVSLSICHTSIVAPICGQDLTGKAMTTDTHFDGLPEVVISVWTWGYYLVT